MWTHHSEASPAQPGPGQSPPAVPVTHGPPDRVGLGSSLSRAGFQFRAAACGKKKGDRSHQEEAGAVRVPEFSCCSCPYREMTLGVDAPLQCPPGGLGSTPGSASPLQTLGGPATPSPEASGTCPPQGEGSATATPHRVCRLAAPAPARSSSEMERGRPHPGRPGVG